MLDRVLRTPPLLKKGLPVVAAASVSLLLHGAVPWMGSGAVREEPSRVSLELLAAPPPLLPVAEEEREGPADDPGEKAPAAPSDVKPRRAKPHRAPRPARAPSEPAEEPAPKPRKARNEARDKAPDKVPEVSAPVASAKRSPVRVRPSLRKGRVARIGTKAGAKVGRGGRKPVARAERGAGGNGGGSTTRLGGGQAGDPSAVYACTADSLGERIEVRQQRPISEWVSVVPTVLVPFDTRPGLGDYFPGIAQVISRRHKGVKRAGPVELALPAEVLQMELDAPRGVRIALGRLDGRCLVGFRYARQLFPLTLHRVPMRVVDHRNRTVEALVDVTLFKDGSFELAHQGGDALPFTKGRLKNADAIKSTIENHYAAARALKEMAGWFGIDLRKMAQQDRAKQARERTGKTRRGKDLARRGEK